MRNPPRGTYDKEPTRVCDLYGYGDSIRKLCFDLHYIFDCKDFYYLKQLQLLDEDGAQIAKFGEKYKEQQKISETKTILLAGHE